MAIGRSQMSQQVSKPPMKKKVKKNAKRRMLQKGKSKVQSVSKRIAKCRKVGAKNWGNKTKVKKAAQGGVMMPSNDFRKRPVRRMLRGGEAIANGCGKVMTNRRKVTKLS
jgi:hypothetical protein